MHMSQEGLTGRFRLIETKNKRNRSRSVSRPIGDRIDPFFLRPIPVERVGAGAPSSLCSFFFAYFYVLCFRPGQYASQPQPQTK